MRLISRKNFLVILCAITGLISAPAQAVLKIDITEGIEAAVPIAVVPFQWNGLPKMLDADVPNIIASDLARSGQFRPLPESDLISRPSKPEQVDFQTWRIQGVDHLVIGNITRQLDGHLKVEFRLFDILKAEQSLGYSFNVQAAQMRSVSHRISDLIIEHLTGLKPSFDSRIAYITTKIDRAKGSISYMLQVADTDGYNPQTLLTSDEPIMSPSWSPDAKRIVYVSYEHGRPEVFMHDIFSGAREKLSSYEGINGAPAWSPDGRYLALTLSKDGSPDIYILRMSDRSLQRLTKHWSIDTEASWMPDSRSIVFTSSRSGKPQLYRVGIALGSKPSRLTFEGNYNADPAVSMDGKVISFVHGEGNHYRIGLFYTETRQMQILTDGPLDEAPAFSPNGGMVIYASQNGGNTKLNAVSVDGNHKHQYTLEKGDVREPSWAPVNPSR